MTPERYQQVKSILADAIEAPDTQSRAELLARECGDDAELRAEVETLLAQPPDEFDHVAETIGLANPEPLGPDETGLRIGAYELVRELGRGGMGTVWLARRADAQFEKLVAIKLLKRGTDTEEVLRRFEAERRILARLDHPNIAHLLDAGMTEQHLPYFVMEYVEGARLTDYAWANNLSLGERLRLFLKICAAVQFAHQNLVVHRDLKPGNILVTAECEPKLLDFGVARLLGPGDDAWQMTIAGQERFTPGYASPEQVRGDPITTVSDVYSLGAILYELLTGRPPHQVAGKTASPTQIARIVCEEEPPRASAVAQDLEIRPKLRGDLDNILVRALAKSPERRYRGAGNFGDDLRRYLENKPVHARPDTVTYRAGKFLLRHRRGALAAGLLLLSLIGGALATLREAHIANRERARAVQRAVQVRTVANSFVADFYNLIADLPGSLPARQLMLARAVDYLDSLARDEAGDLALERELALAYSKIGSVTFDVAQAIALQEKARALNEALVRAAPHESTYQRQLSSSYDQLSDLMKIAGHSGSAIDYARRSLALMTEIAQREPSAENEAAVGVCEQSVAIVLADAGEFASALEQSRSALARLDKFPRGNRQTERQRKAALLQAADDERELGQLEPARQDAQEAFEIARASFEEEPTNSSVQRDMWAAHFHLAQCLDALGDHAAAHENYRNAIAFLEGLAAADPKDAGHQRWLAVTYSAMGETLAALGQMSQARAFEDRALTLSERLANEDNNRAEVKRDLVRIHLDLGGLAVTANDPDGARKHYATAQSIAAALQAIDPGNALVQRMAAETKNAIASSTPPHRG